jgi:hypothetical protein
MRLFKRTAGNPSPQARFAKAVTMTTKQSIILLNVFGANLLIHGHVALASALYFLLAVKLDFSAEGSKWRCKLRLRV